MNVFISRNVRVMQLCQECKLSKSSSPNKMCNIIILHLGVHSAPSHLPVARQVILVVLESKPALQVTPAVALKKLSSGISSNSSPFGNEARLPQSLKKRVLRQIQIHKHDRGQVCFITE